MGHDLSNSPLEAATLISAREFFVDQKQQLSQTELEPHQALGRLTLINQQIEQISSNFVTVLRPQKNGHMYPKVLNSEVKYGMLCRHAALNSLADSQKAPGNETLLMNFSRDGLHLVAETDVHHGAIRWAASFPQRRELALSYLVLTCAGDLYVRSKESFSLVKNIDGPSVIAETFASFFDGAFIHYGQVMS